MFYEARDHKLVKATDVKDALSKLMRVETRDPAVVCWETKKGLIGMVLDSDPSMDLPNDIVVVNLTTGLEIGYIKINSPDPDVILWKIEMAAQNPDGITNRLSINGSSMDHTATFVCIHCDCIFESTIRRQQRTDKLIPGFGICDSCVRYGEASDYDDQGKMCHLSQQD